ncbi:MAG TPA: hypothetical protein VFE50_21165 [Cyclobacteriaceae bacterium]|nr:hypothetical protein [Cyclobacteriaceae bacterium]
MKTRKKIAALIPKEPEQPMLSFNRICFGMMNNDYIQVASSCVNLIVSALLLLQFYNK